MNILQTCRSLAAVCFLVTLSGCQSARKQWLGASAPQVASDESDSDSIKTGESKSFVESEQIAASLPTSAPNRSSQTEPIVALGRLGTTDGVAAAARANLASTVSEANPAVDLASDDASKPHGPALMTLAPGDDLKNHLNEPNRRVIVDFYADWCGPCRQQGRILHDIESYASDAGALIVKVDVDQHKSLARSLSVKSLPTLLVYGDGQILHRRTGLTNEDQLTAWIQLPASADDAVIASKDVANKK